jgi:hypothetical protein
MPGMSERPFKVEQWSKGFAGITRLILETSTPNEAHAEFDRIVKHRPRGWYTVRWGTQVMRSTRASSADSWSPRGEKSRL